MSAWNMKRLMNMVRHGALTTLDEQKIDSPMMMGMPHKLEVKTRQKLLLRKYFRMLLGMVAGYLYFICCLLHIFFFYNFNFSGL